jgi:hypothetical protein
MSSAVARDVIVAKFARWAAMSAARQGCDVRGENWYEHLDQVDLGNLLTMAPVSPSAFGEWHEREVKALASSASVPIGWAAKMVNMLLKVHVYIARRGDPSLLAVIHPPIDRGLVDSISKTFPLNGPDRDANREIRDLARLGKPISGVVTYAQYLKAIEGLTLASKRLGCTVFEVERLWQ